MTRAFEFILTRFPDQRAKIIELYSKDEDFRTLCEDYLTSVEALDQSRQDVFRDRQFENDYLSVNLELEKEIIHLLDTKM